MIHPIPRTPPGTGVAIPTIDALLKQAPASAVAPVQGQPSRREGLCKILGAVTDYDDRDPARPGNAVQRVAERRQIERPITMIAADVVVGWTADCQRDCFVGNMSDCLQAVALNNCIRPDKRVNPDVGAKVRMIKRRIFRKGF